MTRRTFMIALATAAFLAALAPATFAVEQATDGFIYGTVETDRGNTYRGLLRWGTEEAFWDDLFHSSKRDLPYIEEFGRERRKREKFKIFGWTVGYRWDDADRSRLFIARFGDIREIRVRRGDKADVMMRDGTEFRVEGYSNDVGATITVQDESLGAVKIKWDDIERIRFEPTPADVEPVGYRLWGKLVTEDETFEGFIQWDSQESISIDKLDGDSDDGDLSIEMGRIRAIEKRNRSGAWVELKDGRRFLLRGSNDVNSSIRGIYVEDERYGRVKVSWDAFERVDFEEKSTSGRGYNSYRSQRRIQGRVTSFDDRTYTGNLAFDLDEAYSWELLNGTRDDVEYVIPFDIIEEIIPRGRDASRLVLTGGAQVELEDGQDVSDRNDGIVVETSRGERYLPWEDVVRIDFD